MYAIIFTIIFLTGVFAAENKRALEPYSDDWAASTTYLIRHCNYGEADSEASYLQGLLRQINLHLENVIADAQLGTGSSKGYSAFFKSNENVHEVMRVYKQMAAGEDIMVPSILNASILETKPARPTFVCVADTSDHGGMYRQCVNEGSHIPILALPETETVALCPLFWQEDRVPLPRTDCPRISGNTVSPNIRGLYHNQEAMIVFKLAELYGKVDKASNVAMKIQDAVDLDAKHSVESPYNFALYYAAVQAGCRKWPKPRNNVWPRNGARLEIRAKSSDAISAITPYLSAGEYSDDGDSDPYIEDIDSATLQPRQSSCKDWTQAPNSSVCCDQYTGEWTPVDIQSDEIAADPACRHVAAFVGQDGGMVYSATSSAQTASATATSNCKDWTQAPNSSVCCDHNSGQWVETEIESEDPGCPNIVGSIDSNGGMVYSVVSSSTQTTPSAASSTWSSAQQNYCYGQMRLPNSSVCCDMSNGLWRASAIQTDDNDPTMIDAACPDQGQGTINF